ncbi:ferredoxin reductase-like protein [Thozetella sp. PMI_491]|nr:ferredoxin reductase-like protein [Thozetella sp. PMI_491]
MRPAALRPIVRPVVANLNASMNSTTLALGAGIVGAGAYALYLRRAASTEASVLAAAPTKGIFSSFGFNTLKLHSAEMVSSNTKRLRFELPDASQPSGLALSSALITISFPGGGWKPVFRPYTPVNDLDEPGFIELLVKKYPNGKQSTHLHSMQPGDTLTFAPLKEYAWAPNKHPHVALIAGGAGITPMYQLARGILKNPDDQTRITLVWGVNTDEDIFLKSEFAELEKKYPGRFKTHYIVSHPVAGSPYQKGYVTQQFLEGAGLRPSDEKNAETKVFVSGPPPMEKALTGGRGFGKTSGVLQEMGYQAGQIHRF